MYRYRTVTCYDKRENGGQPIFAYIETDLAPSDNPILDRKQFGMIEYGHWIEPGFFPKFELPSQ